MARSDPDKLAAALRANLRRRKSAPPPPALETHENPESPPEKPGKSP
jgi:hypothetical protein